MTQFNLSFDFELEPDFFEDLLDTAGHSIGYWANSASIETMTEDDDEIIYRVNEEDGEEFIITKSDMERTICSIIFGKYSGVSQILKKDLTLLCLFLPFPPSPFLRSLKMKKTLNFVRSRSVFLESYAPAGVRRKSSGDIEKEL